MKSSYTFRRPAENSYLVRERDRRHWRELAFVLLVALPLGMALVSYTWFRLEVLAEGYRIHEREVELEQLRDRGRLLRLEAARLSSPVRLRRVASDLGLVSPSIEQVIFVEALSR